MYLPMHARPDALAGIDAAMKRIAKNIQTEIRGARVTPHIKDGTVLRLLVAADRTQVKIEVSPVLRGVVNEPSIQAVVVEVEDAFGFAETNVVSFEDLYAGKLVAALDRQHPRDLFDVRDLFANEGLTDELRRTFLVYLLSHNRPMGEVLSGRVKDLADEYRDGFEGMTETAVPIEELVETQKRLIDELIGKMPAKHRTFLLGFERGEPDWALLGIPHASDLPAVRWRQQNLDGLAPEKRADLVSLLEQSLDTKH
ncbi:hypothetical protein FIU86_11065 [Roseovarius sp. THAF9]|nr:hypothetical protein FIU86_11065 [Roseovarius sp. THAF9]